MHFIFLILLIFLIISNNNNKLITASQRDDNENETPASSSKVESAAKAQREAKGLAPSKSAAARATPSGLVKFNQSLKLDAIKSIIHQSNDSSYGLSPLDGRSLAKQPASKSGEGKTSKASTTSTNKNHLVDMKNLKKASAKVVAKSAATILLKGEPSLESVAIRIVSAAASKSMGRSHPKEHAHHRDPAPSPSSGFLGLGSSLAPVGHLQSGGASQPASKQPSFLSTLSSTLLSTAITHIMNMTNANHNQLSEPSFSNPPTDVVAVSAPSSQSWQSKLGPLIQSLASSVAGLNLEDLQQTFPTPSLAFLSSGYDLATSSSNSQPALIQHAHSPASLSFHSYNGTARPNSPKQYSSSVSSMINLMRYVLCKWPPPSI